MDDTPLGRVVAVRSETDPKIIAQMNPWRKRIRSEWRRFQAKQTVKKSTPAELRREMAGLEAMLARAFEGGGRG